MRIALRTAAVAALVLLVAASVSTAGEFGFNKSISVAAGEVEDGDLSTLNGSISVGRNARVQGECETVNGAVTLDDGALAESVGTVNGNVRLGKSAEVEESVGSVNGGIDLEEGSRAGSVSNVNGRIRMSGADVAGNVTTINGNVTLTDRTRVGGDLIVEDAGGFNSGRRRPIQIVLSGGSVVEGDLIVRASAYNTLRQRSDPLQAPVR